MKKTLLLLTLLTLALISQAQVPIGTEEALQTACGFVNSRSTLESTSVRLSEVVQSPSCQRSNLYLFSLDPHGFVIVSALNTVLAYSFDNPFPPLEDAPESIAEWIDFYNLTTDYRFEHPEAVPSERTSEITNTVDPLLTSRWQQGCFYNEACPKDKNGPCEHVLAGCVAIAMAQIMYYHKQPAVGFGSNEYSLNYYGTLAADFDSCHYQWEAMQDHLTAPNPAVAELVFHCGVSINMNYGPSSSTGSNAAALKAFWQHFGYYNAGLSSRENYNNAAWTRLLKADLDQSLPIYYTGVKNGEGHAFVCDGYDEEMRFHFNFGWGGGGDGYYNIDDPLGFSNYQQVIHALLPLVNIPVYCDSHGIYYISPDGQGDGSSWENATSNLQFVLCKAYTADVQIWAKEGVYTNISSYDYCFQCPATCRLYGGFKGDEPYDFDLAQRDFLAHPTILDGQSILGVLKQLDPSSDSQLVIDGLTIRNGYADKGGGLNLIGQTTIRNCIIEHNNAISTGGGIYLNGSTQLNLLENCVIRDNQAYYGGGVYDNGRSSRYLNCQFSNNYANSLGGGAYASPYGTICFYNCLCNNNTAALGGGFHFKGGVRIVNSTIVMNEATNNYGGMYSGIVNQENQIFNTVIWGNVSQNSTEQIGPVQNYQYSAVQDDPTTLGHNIKLDAANDGQDPVNYIRFRHLADAVGVAGHGGDWHLLNTSPCIDAGTATVDLPQLDFDEHPRCQHHNPDLGIYESNTAAAHLNDYICDGQSYHHGENEYVEEGYYTILYPQPEYDSLLVLHLTQKETHYIALERNVCEGESVHYSGQSFEEPGHYSWTKDCNNYTLDLTITPAPSLHITGDTIIPYGGRTQLTVTGAESYSWSTGDTTATITVAPLKDMTYQVTGSIQNHCYERLSVNVHVFQEKVFVAPNPANDEVTVNAANIQQVAIYTLLGDRIAIYETDLLPITFSVGNYPSGIYLLWIKCAGEDQLAKLVVTH